MSWRLYPVARFDEFSDGWRLLHAEAGGHALLAVEFMAPLIAAFASGAVHLACCTAHGKVIAMALIEPAGRSGWQTFQPAQAPIGPWLQGPGHDVTELLATLMAALPTMTLHCALTQCDPALLARPPTGKRLDTLDYIATARITLRGSFEDYWNGRGKNLRANLKKQRARLEKSGTRLRLEVLRSSEAMGGAVADFGRLESAGWKGAGGTAVAADNVQGGFYRDMLEAFAQQGRACVYRYWFDDVLVAMDLCVEDQDVIVILKTAYDESVPSHYSPTLLMREEQCRLLFDEARLQRVEFYGKVMEWHTRWTDEIRTVYHINFYRWPLLKRLHALRRGRRGPAAIISEPL